MRYRVDQFAKHLNEALLPIYLITGDEPLQVMEIMNRLRSCARERDYAVREVLEVNKEFSWEDFYATTNSLSLFAEKRIIELRLPTGSPGANGGKSLVEYTQNIPADTLLFIQSGKIDKRSQSSKWFQAIDAVGAIVQVWPIKPHELPRWLQKRLRSVGLAADTDAVDLLAMRAEGNLLAAAQEVDKLALLYGKQGSTVKISLRQMESAVVNTARYSVYDLVDAAVAGKIEHATRILYGLHDEGVATTLILWALANEIRTLSQFSAKLAQGESQSKVLAAVWTSRKSLVISALQRLSLQTWGILVQQCAVADLTIKGLRYDREWDVLLNIVIGLAGSRFLMNEQVL